MVDDTTKFVSQDEYLRNAEAANVIEAVGT